MATSGQYALSRVTRTEAHAMGVKIYDPNTRLPISPEEARRQARDKRAYDQNYECQFADENSTLLTTALVTAAERPDVGTVMEGEWSGAVLESLGASVHPLFAGVDVGRMRDLTVLTVIEKAGDLHLVRAVLRLEGMRLPDQQRRLAAFFSLPQARRVAVDMTGIGLGLYEYSQDAFGGSRVQGVNFGSSVPATKRLMADGRKDQKVRVTEAMATELLAVFEDRRIQIPVDAELRDDLRKPEKVTSPGGRVSIAASRDGRNHADHFWSLALAVEAGHASGPAMVHTVKGGGRRHATRRLL
jgi:phage FluMu gp28-like protein